MLLPSITQGRSRCPQTMNEVEHSTREVAAEVVTEGAFHIAARDWDSLSEALALAQAA